MALEFLAIVLGKSLDLRYTPRPSSFRLKPQIKNHLHIHVALSHVYLLLDCRVRNIRYVSCPTFVGQGKLQAVFTLQWGSQNPVRRCYSVSRNSWRCTWSRTAYAYATSSMSISSHFFGLADHRRSPFSPNPSNSGEIVPIIQMHDTIGGRPRPIFQLRDPVARE